MGYKNSLSDICPVIAYDEERKLFLNDDKTLAFGFACTPLPGTTDSLQAQMSSVLSTDLPKGSMMSFMLYRSPDVDEILDNMQAMRASHVHELLSPIINDRVNFLRYHTRNHIIGRSGQTAYDSGIIVDVKLFITVKIPVNNGLEPTDVERVTVSDYRDKLQSSLAECGFCPRVLDAKTWLRCMSTLFNWSDNASWRNSLTSWQKDVPLNEQFYDNDSDLDDTDTTRSFFGIGRRISPKNNNEEDMYETYVQMLSPKSFPPSMWFGSAIRYMGDFSGADKTIKENYAVICHVYFADHEKQKNFYSRRRQTTAHFAYGPLYKMQPNLEFAMKDLEAYNRSINDGAKAMKLVMSIMMFAPTKKRLLSASTAIQQQFEIDHFKVLPDKYVQREMFFNALPLCGEIPFLFGNEAKRCLSVTNESAIALLPLFSEWKGTGTGHVALISRTGQLMTVSLHDSQTNKNALIAAESGSGKSFYTNELLTMYMSEGAKCWVIDIGRSYAKLCESLGGEFICFDDSKKPCLNIFELVRDYDEENDILKAVVKLMIAPNSTLSDTQSSVLDKVMDEQWAIHKNSLNINLIESALKETAIKMEDQRIMDMATQLYQFTSKGSYGKYFNGKNNIEFNKDFTVLELEELSGRPALRKVVLANLIFQIQQAVFLSKDRSQKKICMIDEAWDLLKEGQSAQFVEHAYRKFRKYNGSMIIATQSLNDLYTASTAGKAIAENSAFYFLLHQKPETIEQVKEEKRLDLSEGGYHWLKSVYTQAGAFSEIFVKSGAGNGIGRLIVSDFQKLLYSTTPEDVQAINNYVNMGYNYTQAINQVLKDRGLYYDFTPQAGQDPHLQLSEIKNFQSDKKLSDLTLDEIRYYCSCIAYNKAKDKAYEDIRKEIVRRGIKNRAELDTEEGRKLLDETVDSLELNLNEEVKEAGLELFRRMCDLMKPKEVVEVDELDEDVGPQQKGA